MILNEEQFYKYINANPRLRYARFIQGFHTGNEDELKELVRFSTINAKGQSLDKFIEQLKEITTNFPEKYTVLLANDQGSSISKIQIDCIPLLETEDVPIQGIRYAEPELDRAKIEAEIRKEIEAEKVQRELKDELEELRKENERIQEPGHKLVWAAEQLIMKFFFSESPQTQPQGMNGTEIPMNQEGLETALNLLCEALGEETIIKLARKLQDPNNSQIIGIVKNFANG